MNAVFSGDHPALDFLNTLFTPSGAQVDAIPDGESFLHWLGEAELLEAAAIAKVKRLYGGKALDAAAADARKLRTWATEWIDRWRERPGEDFGTELRRLNALLVRAHSYREAVQSKGAIQLAAREHLTDAGELVALVACQLAELVANENPDLVKSCAGSGCTLRFLDRTKAHRRLFCSAAACGNRAKVAAFRQRQKPKGTASAR
jgi:predicted RNA-binding Zn ribbon-like protein